MTEIVVRPARPDEYERVGALTVAAYRLLPVDHLWGGYEEEILDTATREGCRALLVAEIDGSLAGAVTYVGDTSSPWSEWTEPGEAQFRLLAVDAAYRGHGAGVALSRACVDRARSTGQPLVIHTTRWMTTAQRIYARLGFVRRPDRDTTYERWNVTPVPNLPPEWVGEPFMAFVYE